MKQFDHVGLPTEEKQRVEMYVATTKVWVTDPLVHPHKVEYLRYEPDSPVTGPVRELPHLAFRVDNLEEAVGSDQVLLGPFKPTAGLRVVFVLKDGAIMEYMEGAGEGDWFEPPADQ
jgi:hypothetical protein